MMERFKGQTYEEVLRMLQVLTPLEETRSYKELVGKGEKMGRQQEALELLTKQLRRRFGRLPRWANDRLRQADLKQLETWAENIFDAKELTDLLGPKPN